MCNIWSRRLDHSGGVHMDAPECTYQCRRLEHSGGVHVNAQASVDVHLFFFFFFDHVYSGTIPKHKTGHG
jgi:hypothetical protein